MPISGPILQEKAKRFAESLGVVNFKASSGWLSKFKSRYDIVGRTVCGESASVDLQVCDDWKSNLSSLLSGYQPSEVYNADETGLFFRCLPNKTLEFRKKECHGGKDSKERLTVLLTANMDGSVKRQPFVIGKSRNPRCFKNVKSFPTSYTSNSKAWMTNKIFKNWLMSWDEELTKTKKKALLFIDNCPAHNSLPPNTTSALQPLDLSIIKNFKMKYRLEIVRHTITNLEKNEPKPVSVLEAMRLIKTAWDFVTPSTISNCFRSCGFHTEAVDTVDFESDIENSWSTMADNFPGLSFSDFVEVDCDLPICPVPSEEEIIDSIRNGQEEEESDDIPDPADEPTPFPLLQKV